MKKRDGGSHITGQNAILEECRTFYKNLYQKNHPEVTTDSQCYQRFLNVDNVPKLTEDQKNSCEGILTEAELYNTLKSFKKNRRPGLDGLTAEFILELWELIKSKLLEVYQESFRNGQLPESLSTGVIVLIEKKGITNS